MIDMLQNAKDLIQKGKVLGDPELIQMGMELLEQYSPTEKTLVRGLGSEAPEPTTEAVEQLKEIIQQDPQYVCGNCGHTMPVDREGRKRCPECKKHKLSIQEPQVSILPDNTIQPDKKEKPSYKDLLEALEQQTQQSANDVDEFRMQVRGHKSGNTHYDDDGNPDGTIRRSEVVDIEGITNIWRDEGEDRNDVQNDKLKLITNVSARTRKPPGHVAVVCENCKRKEHTHPIHASGSRHLCQKCIRRRSQA